MVRNVALEASLSVFELDLALLLWPCYLNSLCIHLRTCSVTSSVVNMRVDT